MRKRFKSRKSPKKIRTAKNNFVNLLTSNYGNISTTKKKIRKKSYFFPRRVKKNNKKRFFIYFANTKIVPEEPELRGGAQYTRANDNIGTNQT